jgi:hypothetical protein
MTGRLLSRLNDQAFATLSAVGYGPVRRIGFLVMPPTSSVGGSSPAAARLIGRSMWQTCEEKSRSRAPRRRKRTKHERLTDTAKQSYQCVIEIIISSPFYEVRMAHPKTILQPSVRFMSTGSANQGHFPPPSFVAGGQVLLSSRPPWGAGDHGFGLGQQRPSRPLFYAREISARFNHEPPTGRAEFL